MQSPITTHVLDTTRGRPAAGVILELAYHSDPDAWQVLARGTTDDDGRNSNLLSGNAPLKTGVYRLTFEVADYFKQLNVDTFYPYVAIVFNVGHPDQYFHVPLLLSPFGYSTYRGSQYIPNFIYLYEHSMEGYEIMALIEVVVRWTHVFAAILWIGQTYLFNFFEKNLEANSSDKNISGNLWMVHGGGFYLVEKQRMPEIMPMTLHWFKWEAAATWISGAVLITLTYYMGGYLVESGMNYTTGMAAGISVIFGSWVVYDMMVRSPIGKNEVLFSLISLMLLMVVHYGLTHVLSSRAAFIHIGALVGTIMAANVWMRILPSQRKMIEATRQGRQPDQTLMATGPLRSKHNSYMVTSLILIMISNHYPTLTYGHRFSTFILAVLIVAGWGVARLFRK